VGKNPCFIVREAYNPYSLQTYTLASSPSSTWSSLSHPILFVPCFYHSPSLVSGTLSHSPFQLTIPTPCTPSFQATVRTIARRHNPSPPFKSFQPSCLNLILSPAQLAQGSIITRFDQNTIYLQQLRLSKCTYGFRDGMECLPATGIRQRLFSHLSILQVFAPRSQWTTTSTAFTLTLYSITPEATGSPSLLQYLPSFNPFRIRGTCNLFTVE
jgi:hypothetical protein